VAGTLKPDPIATQTILVGRSTGRSVAFSRKEENDPNGCTTWGIFRDQDEMPKVMLLWAWRKHLPIHGPTQAPRKITETKEAWWSGSWR
jgi:hypothetical protein